MPLTGGPSLIYVKPEKMAKETLRWALSPTVVLYESLAQHPTGVWVGYADGHLEFAADAATLSADMNQIEIARRAASIQDHYFANAATRPSGSMQPSPVSGELTLRILNPDGKSVLNASIGMTGVFGDAWPGWPHTSFANGPPSKTELVVPVSYRDGLATLDAALVFQHRFATESSVPLYILDERDGLVALENVRQAEFGSDKIHDVHLQPACKVTGKITSVGLRPFGRGITGTICYPLFEGGYFNFNTILSDTNGPYFDLLLPPGDYDFWVYGTDSFHIHHYARIAPGTRTLALQIDLEPSAAVSLIFSGKVAPELRDIRTWKNTPPIKLAGLRGKIVILEFWGYWCGPCVGSMPYLMSIYDEFHDKGLEVIAVHDNTVATIQELDAKLDGIRKRDWNGRNLPFPVAIDGGPVGDPGSNSRGTTSTDYGITSFPTTLVIGRDGKLIEELDLRNPRARDEIAKLLKNPT